MRDSLLRYRNIIGYAALLSVSILLADLFRVWMLFVIVAVLVIAAAVDIMLIGLMYRGVSVNLSAGSPSDIHDKDDKKGAYRNSLHVRIRNISSVPSPALRLVIRSDNSLYDGACVTEFVYAVPSREDRTYIIPLRFVMLGDYSFIVRHAYIRDILGFMDLHIRSGQQCHIAVFPDDPDTSYDVHELINDRDDEDERADISRADQADISDIREYIPGDRIKDIHWKLSVKKGELLVKQRESDMHKGVVILPWKGRTPADTDGVLRMTWQIMDSFVKKDMNVTLMWWDSASYGFLRYDVISEADLEGAYRRLYMSDLSADRDPVDMMALIYPELSSYILIRSSGGSPDAEVISVV